MKEIHASGGRILITEKYPQESFCVFLLFRAGKGARDKMAGHVVEQFGRKKNNLLP